MDLKKAIEYKNKYGCDPCDACGPSSYADCKACVESDASLGQVNPFYRFSD